MVKVNAQIQLKQEHIIEAAIRRFSHFGVNKTTLSEIADDLSISKTLLFYYFQDKNALIAAVAFTIIREFITAVEEVLEGASTLEAGLLGLVGVKREHFKKYFLLALQGDEIDIQKNQGALTAHYQEGRNQLVNMLAALLQKGIHAKTVRPLDAVKTSQLLLETLTAFDYTMKRRNVIPDLENIEELFEKQKEILLLFLNGLKPQACKH